MVRDRPDKAVKYTVPTFGETWDGEEGSRRAARLYSTWQKRDEARYTVLFPRYISSQRASVPVKFSFPGSRAQVEYVLLCRLKSGEWKVCGFRSKK